MRVWLLVLAGLLAVVGLWLRSDSAEVAAPATDVDRPVASAPELIGGRVPTPSADPIEGASPPDDATGATAPTLAEGLDPLETGDCAIHISLVDAATRDEVTSVVQLWRLDAPGNVNFERGDQKQAQVLVPKTGHRFEDLPAGRYRIHVEAQARGTEDPPAFEVAGASDNQHFSLPMPGRHAAFLQIYDEQGVPVLEARTNGGSRRRSTRGFKTPRWRVPRKRKRDTEIIGIGGGAGGAFSGRHRTRAVQAERDGFRLGLVTQPSRTKASWRAYSFEVADGTNVNVDARYGADRTHIFHAASVPMAPIHDAVRMPDGTRALDHGASFYTSCKARLVAPYEIFDARDHRVMIDVSLFGYEKLHFEIVPDEPIAHRALEVSKKP